MRLQPRSAAHTRKCLFSKYAGKFKLHIDGGGGDGGSGGISWLLLGQIFFPWTSFFIHNILMKYFESILLYKWVDKSLPWTYAM